MRTRLSNGMAILGICALSACGGQSGEEAPADSGATEAAPTAASAPETPAPEAAVEAAAFADLTGDAAAGKTVFTKCMSCHIIEDGVNRVGPHLYDIVGREAGSVDGFNYTAANANSGITWTQETLFDYLKAPQDYIPGTRMAFPGIKDAQDRADLVAYLKANGEV